MTQLPVRQRGKIKDLSLSPGLNNDIIIGVFANRHVRSRNIGDAKEQVLDLWFQSIKLFLERFYFIADLFCFPDDAGGIMGETIPYNRVPGCGGPA